MAWIELHNTVRNHRKIYKLMDVLGVSKSQAVGILGLLWTWALEAAENGDLTEFSPRAIADACEWKKGADKLMSALIDSGWIERNGDGHIMIHDWDMYTWRYYDKMEQTREQTRRRVKEYRERKKALHGNEEVTPAPLQPDNENNACNTPTEPNLTEPNLTVPKDNDICAPDGAPDAKPPTKKEVDALFERLWEQYPIKRGSGKVSDAKKRKLAAVGEEHMMRCIDRFKADMKTLERPIDKYLNGSTFFNSGYLDYMDDKFKPIPARGNPYRKKLDCLRYDQRPPEQSGLNKDFDDITIPPPKRGSEKGEEV